MDIKESRIWTIPIGEGFLLFAVKDGQLKMQVQGTGAAELDTYSLRQLRETLYTLDETVSAAEESDDD